MATAVVVVVVSLETWMVSTKVDTMLSMFVTGWMEAPGGGVARSVPAAALATNACLTLLIRVELRPLEELELLSVVMNVIWAPMLYLPGVEVSRVHVMTMELAPMPLKKRVI